MRFATRGHLTRSGDALESVRIPGIAVHLLAHGDGCEVIRQDLKEHAIVGMRPEQGWTALEMMFILSGRLRVEGTGDIVRAGDSLSAHPVVEPLILKALEPSSILYISSQPVFHAYTGELADLFRLATEVEVKDGATKDHCKRIQRLSLAVGNALGLHPKQMYALTYGSFVHDIGKVRIPDSILGKPGPLTPDEWRVMRQHPAFGAEIVGQRPYMKDAAAIVAQHHERIDGSGYPAGMKGEDILLEARIVAVVDAFDAMTSDRPYRKSLGHPYANDELRRHRGSAFDAQVVDTFLGLLADGLPEDSRAASVATAANGQPSPERR